MNIGIGGDHAGFEHKADIIEMLKTNGHEVKDFGPYSTDSVDYPDFAHPVSESVESGESELGILICGSGNGVSMVANKHQGIRAALCWEVELAELARKHNNANILSIAARFVSQEKALEMVEAFLSTKFEGGRHENRVNKINC